MFKGLAKGLGEFARMYKTSDNEKKLTEEQRQIVDEIFSKAESGDVQSMFEIGSMYYDGEYLPYDPLKAVEWFEKAARGGEVVAMYNLGLMYIGNVTETVYDDEKAVYWLLEAIKNGYSDAEKELNQNFKMSKFTGKWKRI